MLFMTMLWLAGAAAPTWGVEKTVVRIETSKCQDPAEEYKRLKEGAGKDVAKLWELYLWCEARSMARESKSVLWRIVRADDSHKEAHTLLGHLFFDGEWFTSEKKLAKHKRVEAERKAKEEGLVRWNEQWVRKEDIPKLERGLVQNELGEWVSKQMLERVKAGWSKQDFEWISPEEEEKVAAGLWKCGTTWRPLAEANAWHGMIERWWRIPGDHVDITSTCKRKTALDAMDLSEKAMRDMARVFGVQVEGKPNVLVLKDAEQYRLFSSGNQNTGLQAADILGLSSVHYAFFAEGWFDVATGEYLGTGACYWDTSSDAQKKFGVHSVRHAAGLAYLQRLDPSPKWLEQAGQDRIKAVRDMASFWGEKKLPRWLWYGGAAYAERYYKDAADDPFWTRKWSISNILGRGGLRPLPKLLEGELTVDKPEDSGRMINELGLIVSFIVDGNCAPVKAQHGLFKETMASGKGFSEAAAALAQVLLAHEKDLRAYAGF